MKVRNYFSQFRCNRNPASQMTHLRLQFTEQQKYCSNLPEKLNAKVIKSKQNSFFLI